MEANSSRGNSGRPSFSRPSSHTHNLSSSSIASSAASRKGRHVEPVETHDVVEPAGLSMPPPPRLLRGPRSSLPQSRRQSTSSETWSEDFRPPVDDDLSTDEIDITPKLEAGISGHGADLHRQLPEPALTHQMSFSENEAKRLSISSLYSLGSGRGLSSSAVSITGSDGGLAPRSVSSYMASNLGIGPSTGQPDAEVSNVTVTTTTNQNPVGPGHQLTPRELPHNNPLEYVKRNPPRSDPSARAQPPRSRSRAKRRFSGSTGASSHSPSSDRAPYSRDREDIKPAPWGVIGVCALDSKARSKPSRNILNKLIKNHEFDVAVFGDKTILDEEVENWPVCDYLISFYSDGFPLDKAIAYVKLRNPFCVNDVLMQKILWDRRVCLDLLNKINVRTPQRIEVTRDGGPSILTPEIAQHIVEVAGVSLKLPEPSGTPKPRQVELVDDGDTLCVDGAMLKKPFVEKPISGEDHNIIIYFPHSTGGGARKLFRKIGNKSSEYVEGLEVPRAITEPENSYIYEKFMQVDNAEDVKAYTVGPHYCHAETRKSPVVDGVVRRNTHGKEIRYITPLSDEEKDIASKISRTFGQRVCGFDLLRAGGKSYVIDVNGWSFVKDNEEYYDQCASILKDIFMKEKMLRGGPGGPLPSPAVSDGNDPFARSIHSGREHEAQPTSVHPHPVKSFGNIPLLSADQQSTSTGSIPKSESGLSGIVAKIHHGIMQRNTDSPNSDLPSTAPATTPATPALDSVGGKLEAKDGPPTAAPPPPKHSWKLKGMVSVIRHADRTPKQKYKFTFHTEPFIELLRGHQEEVLLIGEAALASVLDAVDIAIRAGEEDPAKLRALRNVLVKKGGWAGTKVQIKPMFRKKKSEEKDLFSTPKVTEGVALDSQQPSPQIKDLQEQAKADGTPGDEQAFDENAPHGLTKRHDSMSGVTMSKFTAAENSLVLDKLQLIVKWGGEPTHSARYQAQELAQNMRNDLLLLNRHILDEVHVYSSSERRVTTSAQIWSASFLDKKDLPEDFITVRKDLLDDSNAAKDEMDKVKKKLKGLLRKGNERPSQFAWPEGMPEPAEVQNRVVQLMNFHRRVMQYNYSKLHSGAVSSLSAITNPSSEKLNGEGPSGAMASSLSQANAINNIQQRWCCGEDAELFRERWEKLFAEFCDNEKVDPSKISELYDTMKFDALHNRQFLEWVFTPPRHMLEEDYGITVGRDGKLIPKESDESKTSDDRSDRSASVASQAGERSDKLERPEKTERSERPERAERSDKVESQKAVKRIFRRRSWMMPRPTIGIAPPEQYFHLHRGDSMSKAKTDARFEPLRELYQLAKVLFDFICPQEYGISDSEKLEIGLLTSLPLLQEIVQDLEEMQASDEAKSFFYFTKESHIYTLLNCILEGGIETKINRRTIPELDYLSQICFELYESEAKPTADSVSEEFPTFTYSIRISISPGCHVYDPLDIQLDSKHCIGNAPRRSLTPHGDWKKVIETLRAKFHQVKLPKTFVAVNLSDAFSFQEKERQNSEADALEKQNQESADPAPPEDEGKSAEFAPAAADQAEEPREATAQSSLEHGAKPEGTAASDDQKEAVNL